MTQATQIRLKKRADGVPQDDVWETTHDTPAELGDGEIAVDVQYVSVDPAMRGWIVDTPSYLPPVQIGEVMRAGGLGTVTGSRADGIAVGDIVRGITGVQSHYVGPAQGFTVAQPDLAPARKFLAGLGMPGMTAYFGLLEVGALKEGDTVLISGAGGAVGSVAGQIAKIKGCRVVGIAGGPDKCDTVVNRYGFDACIDYKSENVGKTIRSHCPDGVDIYFDNVGGPTLDAALANIAMHARIALCGAISGPAVARGVSFLREKMGEHIFAKGINIIDDPHRPWGFGSHPFDGEGIATQRRHIIEDGRLAQWFLNCAAARQLGLEPNGFANRNLGGPPGAGPSNLHLEAGAQSREDMIAAIDDGVLITEMFGPSLNANTGSWSVGVSGFRITKGKIDHPVSEITVAGDLNDIFMRLVPADDLYFRGSINAPSVFVDQLAIGGA